ncbi:M15 family metallopeptidase [Microbacterium sp. Au-Mic1]|uniref:M15 family metallopeptidase n=1 Tax=Microbacterium sp. Au-Mic1 TaxID=2906457 RepID=UPI001E5E6D2E|nr:M15 family metallopeptidase [Microbacterium sp. Au-Mic1]MCE4026144.1 M15 family metallopeptidase [Microbacterium sp. Au-Mic1]
MPYDYTTIDSHRVEAHVAGAFSGLRSAFHETFGFDLLVTDGTRTRAEQAELYDGWINRRPGYSLAAAPGLSNHEETGPRGPRALDVRDTGPDAGVTRIGTERSRWLCENGPGHGFVAAGYDFRPARSLAHRIHRSTRRLGIRGR